MSTGGLPDTYGRDRRAQLRMNNSTPITKSREGLSYGKIAENTGCWHSSGGLPTIAALKEALKGWSGVGVGSGEFLAAGSGALQPMIEALKSDEIVNRIGGRFKLCSLIQRRHRAVDGRGPPAGRAQRAF